MIRIGRLVLFSAVAMLASCKNFIRLPDPTPEFRQAESARLHAHPPHVEPVKVIPKPYVIMGAEAVPASTLQHAKPLPPDPDVLVWLISDELHTGMVFPYDWLIESGFVPPKNFGHPRFVTLSWGNRTAYVNKGLRTAGEVYTALFTNSPAVMELIPVYYEVVDQCPHQRIYRKLVPREKGRELALYLNWCSVRDHEGRPIVCGTSSWGGGVLLESRHTYYFPRICNIWTLQAMETFGPRMNPWRGVFADGIIRQAEKPENGFEQVWFGMEKKKTPAANAVSVPIQP